MTTAPIYPLLTADGGPDWMAHRLTKARGIPAGALRHPKSLAILAARVVAGQTDSTSKCSDAPNSENVIVWASRKYVATGPTVPHTMFIDLPP